ncbi:carboxypeptidase-like regulatory domain-containing protein [Mucilaginibacter agri]|uniref:Carboxypeptidase-like regulatory domain-containing protein n=1 Tax=Mucilaginibacter agri TaxID=2695265 RepID=A0A965ZLJ8_9SPHI|nr:carboxypeptidase-like regulatory domain-containing protein [Mucilaginibacter agri]NCD71826.1 hypothetical protein [Mucilaginibacter agri]
MKTLCIFLLCLLLGDCAVAQQKVYGKVTDSTDHAPLPGTTLTIKGTKIGTQSDLNGDYTLIIPDSIFKSTFEIVANFVGYTSTSFKLNPLDKNFSNLLNIRLAGISAGANDVVVVGYGYRDSSKATSAHDRPKPSARPSIQDDIPIFPWPPPDFSARQVLKAQYFKSAKKLSDYDKILTQALDDLNYTDPSYFYIPNGFALVTRIEQIQTNGQTLPPPYRWSAKTSIWPPLSWKSYFKSLFFPNPGFFRIIVFAVTDSAFTSSGKQISKDDATKWLNAGLNKLPSVIGNLTATPGYNCTVLIYEFQKEESSDAKLLLPSPITGADHLEKSKITAKLNGHSNE